mmetsp:Transcript_16478/g.45176  ORF Transcript_16478/g.45176 Transcript_16478/m.45176 type:complete len:272 (-) Transcript_16478:62-877(-)
MVKMRFITLMASARPSGIRYQFKPSTIALTMMMQAFSSSKPCEPDKRAQWARNFIQRLELGSSRICLISSSSNSWDKLLSLAQLSSDSSLLSSSVLDRLGNSGSSPWFAAQPLPVMGSSSSSSTLFLCSSHDELLLCSSCDEPRVCSNSPSPAIFESCLLLSSFSTTPPPKLTAVGRLLILLRNPFSPGSFPASPPPSPTLPPPLPRPTAATAAAAVTSAEVSSGLPLPPSLDFGSDRREADTECSRVGWSMVLVLLVVSVGGETGGWCGW